MAIFILVDWIFWCVIFILVGYLCCVGMSLFCWLYMFGVLSLLCWAICILVGCGLFILVGYLYSGGLSVFWWAICILVGHLYSGGMPIVCHYFSCGQSTEIIDYIFQLCVHTLHSILQNVCFIELPCQP